MIRVANRGCIRRLGLRSMKAAQTRNIVAVLAIALTTVLFTSLFTIASSINYSFQQENFRQAGATSTPPSRGSPGSRWRSCGRTP